MVLLPLLSQGRMPTPDDIVLNPVEGRVEQREFDYFMELRNAGLLETADNQDLYFLATETHAEISLSSKGQYFWQLVDRGRL